MAPTKKRARPRDRARNAAKPALTSSTNASTTSPSGQNSKKAKRQSRHDALLHRISATAPGKIRRRRRKGTTLPLPDMHGMLDALPDWEGFSADEEGKDAATSAMKMRTLKSRRGASKAKAKLEKSETERFGKNMAAMTAGAAQVQSQQGQADRWAALRGFIGRTMETSALFKA